MTTILLADDHQVVREGVRALLAAHPDFTVAGEVAEGTQVLAAVARLQPQVLIVDLMLPGLGGLEITREVLRHHPKTRVVVLSMHAAAGFVREALRAGALGYVVKDAGSAELVRAIREVAAGRRYLSPALAQQVMATYAGDQVEPVSDAHAALTDRERQVLRLTSEGLPDKDIARRLGISPRTVETHRANVMKKLGLQNRTELIRYALSQGLLPEA